MAKGVSFDFGFNVKPKSAPKKNKGEQGKGARQAFAMAKAKGGPLHGRSGS